MMQPLNQFLNVFDTFFRKFRILLLNKYLIIFISLIHVDVFICYNISGILFLPYFLGIVLFHLVQKMTDECTGRIEELFESTGPQRRVIQRPEEVAVDVRETDLKSSMRPRTASVTGSTR